MILSLDIGGSKIAVGLVSKQNRVISKTAYLTNAERGSRALLRTITTLVSKHITHKVTGIGIGIAGQVDSKSGMYRSGPNLPLRNINLKTIVQKISKRTVSIHNDAQCFALAEATIGAGKPYQSVFVITIGTGIGGGFVINKKLVSGSTAVAGEIGHIPLSFGEKTQPRCTCGKRGHLEAYAGGRAMTLRYQSLKKQTITVQELEERFKKNDRVAMVVVNEASAALASGFVTILTLLNPDCIVVGGGLARFRELWQPAIRLARNQVPFPELKNVPIMQSKLGDNAGLIGAALLIRKNS